MHVGYTVEGERHSLSASVQVSLGGCYGDSRVGWSGAVIMVAVCTEQYSSSSPIHSLGHVQMPIADHLQVESFYTRLYIVKSRLCKRSREFV